MSSPTPPKAPTSGTEETLFSPLTRLNLLILCLAFFMFLGIQLTELLPAIIAMLGASLILTYLLLSPVQWLESALARLTSQRLKLSGGMRRVLAIALVYLAGLGLFGLSVAQIATPLSIQIKDFAKDIPQHFSKSTFEPLPPSYSSSRIHSSHPSLSHPSSHFKRVLLQGSKARIFSVTQTLITQKFTGIFKNYATKLGHYVLDVGTTALSSLIYILTTLVLTFYLLQDGEALSNGLVSLMPNRHEPAAKQFLTRLHRQFYTVVKGQVLMSFLSGSLMYTALMLLGVKYALLLGLLLGGLSILPVIGPWLGLLPIVTVVEMGGHPIHILPVLLVAGCFYLLKAYWLWPKLVSRKFDLHPILFILTFLVCIKIMGFSGIFLSFPLASVIGVWLDIQKARHSKAYITQRRASL